MPAVSRPGRRRRTSAARDGPVAVTAYIAGAPPPARLMLTRIREAIKAAAPRAQEKLSYGMPYYSQQGRLAYFAAFRDHVSVFIPGRVLAAFAKEIKPYWRGKATLQFPIGTRVPVGLIGRLVRARRRENESPWLPIRSSVYPLT